MMHLHVLYMYNVHCTKYLRSCTLAISTLVRVRYVLERESYGG